MIRRILKMGALARLLEARMRELGPVSVLYTVSYDLHGDDADYTRLYKMLEKLCAVPHTESTFFFRSTESLETLCNLMQVYVNDDDSFVLSIVDDFCTVNC